MNLIFFQNNCPSIDRIEIYEKVLLRTDYRLRNCMSCEVGSDFSEITDQIENRLDKVSILINTFVTEWMLVKDGLYIGDWRLVDKEKISFCSSFLPDLKFSSMFAIYDLKNANQFSDEVGRNLLSRRIKVLEKFNRTFLNVNEY